MIDTSKLGQLATEGQPSLPHLLGTISSWLAEMGRWRKAAVPRHDKALEGDDSNRMHTTVYSWAKSLYSKRAVSSLNNKWRRGGGSLSEGLSSSYYLEDTGWAPPPDCWCSSVLDSFHSAFPYSVSYSLVCCGFLFSGSSTHFIS